MNNVYCDITVDITLMQLHNKSKINFLCIYICSKQCRMAFNFLDDQPESLLQNSEKFYVNW